MLSIKMIHRFTLVLVTFIVFALILAHEAYSQNGKVSRQHCHQEGLTRNPNDNSCKTFLQCVNGLNDIENCPFGQLFYPEIGMCVDKSAYTCGSPVHCGNYDRFVSISGDCRSYYTCFGYYGMKRSCSANMIFNNITGFCEYGSKSNCQSETSFSCPQVNGNYPNTRDNSCTSYYECRKGQYKKKQCPSGYKFHSYHTVRRCLSAESVVCDEPNQFICPSSNGNYADPKSCARYYTCDNSAPLRKICPVGQIYVDSLKKCTDGDQNTCVASSSFQCPQKNGNYTNKRDDSCASYYECQNGQYKKRQCPSGHKFHPHHIIHQCLLADSVDCNDPNPFICPSSKDYHADPKSCARFYSCHNSAPIHNTCPAGQIFVDSLKQCTDGDQKTCVASSSFQCPRENGNYTNPSDNSCASYFKCENGHYSRKQCQSGLKFHSHHTIRGCRPAKEVDCNDPNPFICRTPRGFYVDPNSCARYYTCYKYAPIHDTCPTGQIFVDSVKKCKDGDQKTCVARSSFQCPRVNGDFGDPSDANCRYYFQCSNGVPRRIQCPYNYKFHPHSTLRRCMEADTVDCNDPDPFYCPTANKDVPDPKNCSRFYDCTNYAPLHRTCGWGQIFKRFNNRCESGDPIRCV